MRRAKPKKPQTYKASDVKRVKEQVTKDVIDKVFLLFMAATVNTLGLTDEQVVQLAKNYDRYAGYIDDHLVEMAQVQKTIEDGTGIKLKGWTK